MPGVLFLLHEKEDNHEEIRKLVHKICLAVMAGIVIGAISALAVNIIRH